jgi:hypothetical protein
MAFNIEISDTVKFTVRFTTKDASGTEKPASFDLIARRLDVDEYKDALASETSVTFSDFLGTVVTGWEGVRDGAGTPVEFSQDGLRRLCKVPGLASLMFKTYGAEVSVKEKN